MSQRLIREQEEISGVSQIRWPTSSWEKLSLVNDKEAIRISTAKVYVFSDSVLCLGKMREFPQSNVEWENKLQWFQDSKQYREFDRIDGEPTEFEWNIFPGFNTFQILSGVQNLGDLNSKPEQFKGRIIFLSMYDDIRWGNSRNEEVCVANSIFVAKYAQRFSLGHWSFLGPGSETKLNADTYKPCGPWDTVAEIMINFDESGHPVVRQVPWNEEPLKVKVDNYPCIYAVNYDTVEVLFRV